MTARRLIAYLAAVCLLFAAAVVWHRNKDPLARTLTGVTAPIEVDMASTYRVDATDFALQCGYQSDQEAADALEIPKEKAQDLTWIDSREVLYFRGNDSSSVKVITLPENVRLCLGIPEHLTWMPLTSICFTPYSDYQPGQKLWHGTLCRPSAS